MCDSSTYKGCDWLKVYVDGYEVTGPITVIDIDQARVEVIDISGSRRWLKGDIVFVDSRLPPNGKV